MEKLSFGRFSDDPAGRVDQGLDPEVDPEAREFRIVRSKALVHVDLELKETFKFVYRYWKNAKYYFICLSKFFFGGAGSSGSYQLRDFYS